MTSDKEQPDGDQSKRDDSESSDIVLDLNFVPEWARKPADANPYANETDQRDARPQRRDRRERQGGGGKGRRDDRRGGRSNDRGPRDQKSRGDQGRPPRGRGGPRQRPHGQRGSHRHQRPVRIPVRISFVPERDKIGSVVHDIRESTHAFPLQNVAALFMAKPDDYLVKFEVQKGNQDHQQRLYQCKETKHVFLDEEQLKAHCLKHVLDKHYEAQDIEVDAPAGNFVCVSRCKLSGRLLGPPNHHSFKAQLAALHAERFSHMTLEEYRRNVQTVHDPEVIEKWKEASKKKTIYKLKEGGDDAGEMTRAEAEEHFLQHIYPTVRHVANKIVLPAEVSRNLEDRNLLNAIREAWNKENRNFFTLSIALRPAFKHMGLALFRVGGNTYVSRIPPKPIDKDHVVDEVGEIIEFIEANPGCSRKELKEALRPGVADESEEVNQLVHHLTWLEDKGHVIEFFNGRLALPMKAGGRSQKTGDSKKTDVAKPTEPAENKKKDDALPPAREEAGSEKPSSNQPS